jgi:hypothetical protein
VLAVAAVLAAFPVLAACGAGRSGSMPYVAEFGLGAQTPDTQEFVLTPIPGPRVEMLPEPISPRRVPVPGSGEGRQPPDAPSPPPTPDSGGPSPLVPALQPSIAWVNDGQYLGVVTYGSSSCPDGPVGLEVVAEQEIHVRLGRLFPDRDPCTADVSGHVTVVELPPGVAPSKPLVARFADHEVTIAAVRR